VRLALVVTLTYIVNLAQPPPLYHLSQVFADTPNSGTWCRKEMGSLIVSLGDVVFTYQHSQSPALNGITLNIGEGTIAALVGAVGAGKTTLLLTLNGQIPEFIPGHLAGDIVVDGVNSRDVEPAQMAEHVGLVFADPSLQIVGLTVEEDVAFGPGNLGLIASQIRERVGEALRRVRLDGFEKRNPRKLSGGEQQLLAVGGILAMRPRVVAMDEPVAMLDPMGKAMVLQAAKEMRDRFGITVFIGESGTDIESVCEFVDTVFLIDHGQVVAQGSPGEVFADRKLIEKARVKAPQVTRLAWELDLATDGGDIPTTLSQAYEGIVPLLRERPVSITQRMPEKQAVAGRPIIELSNVRHTYPVTPPVDALRGIDLIVREGEMVAILGQNGSGKTTLAYHLVGVLKCSNEDGVVKVDGLDVSTAPLQEIVQHINYVFQNPSNQLFCSTFGEEVGYGPQRLGLSEAEIRKRVQQSLKRVGMEDLEDADTVGISRAGESLLSLAAVLSMEPRILVVDEPTGGLDWDAGRRVMEILTDLNREGRTIIVITHDMELAALYCQRIIVLKEGQILMDGLPREVFSQPEVLRTSSLYPPQITQLAQRLGQYGMPSDVVTVEEFVRLMARE